jgi:hypothetical protein
MASDFAEQALDATDDRIRSASLFAQRGEVAGDFAQQALGATDGRIRSAGLLTKPGEVAGDFAEQALDANDGRIRRLWLVSMAQSAQCRQQGPHGSLSREWTRVGPMRNQPAG